MFMLTLSAIALYWAFVAMLLCNLLFVYQIGRRGLSQFHYNRTFTNLLWFRVSVLMCAAYLALSLTGVRYEPDLPSWLGSPTPSSVMLVLVGGYLSAYLLGKLLGSPQRSFNQLRLSYEGVILRQGYWFDHRGDADHYRNSMETLLATLDGYDQILSELVRSLGSAISYQQAMTVQYQRALLLATISRYDDARRALLEAQNYEESLSSKDASLLGSKDASLLAANEARVMKAKMLFLDGELSIVLGDLGRASLSLQASKAINEQLGRHDLVGETNERLATIGASGGTT